MVVRKVYDVYYNLVHTLQNNGVIFTPFRSDDHSKAIHSWGMTNDGVIFTPFRSNISLQSPSLLGNDCME